MKRGIILFVAIICVATCMCGCSDKKEIMVQEIKDCSNQYGVEDIDVSLYEDDYHQVFLCCSNFASLDWNTIFEMDRELNDINGVDGVAYIEGKRNAGQAYYVHQDENEIQTFNNGEDVVYHGGWDDKSSENMQERLDEHKDAVNQEKDRLISTHECGICGKQASKRIDDEYYCDEHYEDAIEWYMEQNTNDN